jgi:hypothetical protein
VTVQQDVVAAPDDQRILAPLGEDLPLEIGKLVRAAGRDQRGELGVDADGVAQITVWPFCAPVGSRLHGHASPS